MQGNRRLQGTNTDAGGTEYSSSKSPPKILTRTTDLPSLSALDAGDIVECYALTRMAKLENSMGASSSSLIVRKSAIAFRYKPKSSSPDVHDKEPFELTLEYGPQRTGPTQSFEAMPSVNGHYRGLAYEDGDGMYVSWENHGTYFVLIDVSLVRYSIFDVFFSFLMFTCLYRINTLQPKYIMHCPYRMRTGIMRITWHHLQVLYCPRC
jgi:hypothetical protein